MDPAAASFYVTGGTLRQAGEPRFDAQRQRRGPGPGPSYVERQADKDLYAGLTRGEFCYVLTSRQMGKSSLMVHTAARLREAGAVVFIDEIDAVRSLPLSTDEFFAAIRECYYRRARDPQFQRLTFCLLGVASPSDLIQDTRTTPFNIGRRIELTDFTLGEAAPLTEGLGRDERTAALLLERVLDWTGGHPYLTQRLCQAVVEGGVTEPSEVDQRCGELFLSPSARERDDNLRGLLPATAVSSLILAVLATLAVSAVNQSHRAEQQRRLTQEREQIGRRYRYGAQMKVAQQA